MTAEFADITDQIERKIMGINIYESQLERLFDGTREMADAVRSYGRAMAELGCGRRSRGAVLGLDPRLTPSPDAVGRRVSRPAPPR